MADLDRTLLRKLAEWTPAPYPVVSLYLSVDGRRFPRRQDYEPRLTDLTRRIADAADRATDRRVGRSLGDDLAAIEGFVEGFDRGSIRGLVTFTASGAGLWEELLLSRPVRDRVEIGPTPHLLPLEALVETYEAFCTVLVDGEKARIFLAELGRIEEEAGLVDDVPGRHDQGGWAQGRFQRHIGDHRTRHLKRVAEALFGFFRRRRFDHLILSGPDELVAEFERELHDWLRQRVRARVHLPITASGAEVLERSLQIEEDFEREAERAAVAKLMAEAAAGRRGVAGLGSVLRALGESRAGTLVVAAKLHAPGVACSGCGRLAERGRRCAACGGELHDVPDVVEAAVAQAFRQGAEVQIVTEDGDLRELGGIGALLRF
jgi:peptide chain release factor subunit 1